MRDFRQFSEPSIKIVMLAQDEARRLGHNYVGAEQLLVGLLRTDSRARQLLNDAGIDLQGVKLEIEKVSGRGSGFLAVEMPFTPQAERALDRATNLALSNCAAIQPEHLLIGVLDSGESVLLRILENLSASVPQLRDEAFALFFSDNQVESEPKEEFSPGDTVFVVAQNIKFPTKKNQSSLEKAVSLTYGDGFYTLPYCVIETTVVRKTFTKGKEVYSYHVFMWEYDRAGSRTVVKEVRADKVFSSGGEALDIISQSYRRLVDLSEYVRTLEED